MLSIFWAIMFAILPPCEYEDSSNCKWDAGSYGNHIGDSFIDIGGQVYYDPANLPSNKTMLGETIP